MNLPQQSVLRVDVETGAVVTWSPGERWYLGEPTIVPRQPPHPGAGWPSWMRVEAIE